VITAPDSRAGSWSARTRPTSSRRSSTRTSGRRIIPECGAFWRKINAPKYLSRVPPPDLDGLEAIASDDSPRIGQAGEDVLLDQIGIVVEDLRVAGALREQAQDQLDRDAQSSHHRLPAEGLGIRGYSCQQLVLAHGGTLQSGRVYRASIRLSHSSDAQAVSCRCCDSGSGGSAREALATCYGGSHAGNPRSDENPAHTEETATLCEIPSPNPRPRHAARDRNSMSIPSTVRTLSRFASVGLPSSESIR